MKKITIFIIALLAVGTFVFLRARGKQENTGAFLEFVSVSKGELIISIKESGYLNSVEEEKIKNECTIKELNVVELIENGTFVEKGSLLIQLDAAPLEEEKFKRIEKFQLVETELIEAQNTLAITQSEVASAINKASSEIDFAKMDLEKFEKLDKNRQLEDALAQIASNTDELKLSEQTYTVTQELAKKGFETKSKLERDKLDLASRQKQLSSAQAKYEALKEFDLKKEALKLKRAVSESLATHDRAKRDGDNKIKRGEAKVIGVEAKLVNATEALSQIEEEISKTKIYSPVTGYALYPKQKNGRIEPAIEKGKKAFRNQTLMRIPNMNNMKLDIEVAEHFVNDLKIGQKAVVTIDSLKEQKFNATVSHVALMPVAQNHWSRSGSQKYTITVNVNDEELPDSIKPQISASTEIFLDTIEDTLSVPVQAVHTDKGQQVIFIKATNELGYTQQVVQIGKMNTNYIQILSGISEDDQVLISEPSSK